MKIRLGFVSNSSSASFILSINDINAIQLWQIINLRETAHNLDLPGVDYTEGWDIKIKDKKIYGYTSMDNFDILEFFDKINIDRKLVKYGDSNLEFGE